MSAGNRIARFVLAAVAFSAASACAPTVDILGVYFPGWLVAVITSVVASYLAVSSLGRWAWARTLAQSGLFFVSLTVVISLTLWWALFSGF